VRFGSTVGRRLTALAVATSLLLLSGCSNERTSGVELPSQADAALPDDITTRIDDAVTRSMGLAAAPGAIVGVWAPWSGFHVEAYGTTEVGGDEPMTTDMHFRTAAVTKAMTCTVLLGLVDDGRVELDDPVSDYVTIVGTEGVTLGQLCQSTSGLGNFRDSFESQFVDNPTRPWVDEELVTDGIARTGDAEPGTAFRGNDTGYVLLGMALERAGGSSLSSLYQRYVFDPIGMTDSRMPGATTTTLPAPAPHGYEVVSDDCAAPRDVSKLSPSMLGAAGGAVSTVDDLRRFAQAFASGSPFSSATAKTQWETVPLGGKSPTWQSYGYGGYQLGTMRGQFGDIPGFSTAAFSDPDTGLTVVVMLNASTASTQLTKALALELASYASTAPATGENSTPEPSLPWSPEQMQQESAGAAVCQ
jgi:D-alanyl-D-alanine carboxypeptidase